MTLTATRTWNEVLREQLDFHYQRLFRPRLEGLTDEEYLWEPVPGCWSIRPRGTSTSPAPIGAGDLQRDDAPDDPDPAPVTTIAWRMGHLLVGVFGERNARYFGGPPVDYASYDYPLTADDALAQLDDGYRLWNDGVRGLTAADLAARCREPGFETDSMAMLILHINRELGHHGAEINLLRDLYLWR